MYVMCRGALSCPVSRFHTGWCVEKSDSKYGVVVHLCAASAANEQADERANQTQVLGSVDFAPDCSYRLPTRERGR